MNLVDTTLSKGKKSLNELLRNKAFEDVAKILEDKGIDINEIDENDLEELVAAKASDMKTGLKGIVAGGTFVALLEALI